MEGSNIHEVSHLLRKCDGTAKAMYGRIVSWRLELTANTKVELEAEVREYV